jgi:hypothetical protein
LYNAPDEEVRRYNLMSGIMGQMSNQAAADFFKRSVLGDVPKQEKDYVKTLKMELLTQLDANRGDLASANGLLAAAKARGMTSPKSYSDFIDAVSMIGDKEWGQEARANLARGFFDPVKNAGLLSDNNFKKDYIDSNGRQVPGKYSVFNRLADPKVAGGIADLQRPDISLDYRTMMGREFGEQLFSRELKDLASSNADASNARGYKVAYVSEKGQPPRFDIVDNNGRPMTDAEALALRAPVQAKNRLNSGLTGLYTVYSSTGSTQPNVDILNTMYKYGYSAAKEGNLDKGWSGEATDVPRAFWNSLVAVQQERLRKAGEAMRKKESE